MVIYVILELIYFQVLSITEKEIINSTPEDILYEFYNRKGDDIRCMMKF